MAMAARMVTGKELEELPGIKVPCEDESTTFSEDEVRSTQFRTQPIPSGSLTHVSTRVERTLVAGTSSPFDDGST